MCCFLPFESVQGLAADLAGLDGGFTDRGEVLPGGNIIIDAQGDFRETSAHPTVGEQPVCQKQASGTIWDMTVRGSTQSESC